MSSERTTRTTPAVDIHRVLRPVDEEAAPADLFTLLDHQADVDEADRPVSIAERFEQFNRDNPKVLEHLVRLAREWIASTGSRKVGINGLVEQVRWRVAVTTNDPDFKVNNIFCPFYSRLIAATHPDLADCFEYRRSVADEWIAGRTDQIGKAA